MTQAFHLSFEHLTGHGIRGYADTCPVHVHVRKKDGSAGAMGAGVAWALSEAMDPRCVGIAGMGPAARRRCRKRLEPGGWGGGGNYGCRKRLEPLTAADCRLLTAA